MADTTLPPIVFSDEVVQIVAGLLIEQAERHQQESSDDSDSSPEVPRAY